MTMLQQINDGQAYAEVPVNENFDTLSHIGIYGKRQPGTYGQIWAYYGGIFNGVVVNNGELFLTPSAVNHIVVERATGVVYANTVTTFWNDPALYGRLYKVTLANGLVTAEEDHRYDGLVRAAPGAGVGDVAGPASAVDGRPALFNGASGKLLKQGAGLLTGTNTGDETAARVGALIDGAAQTSPVNSDKIGIADSANGFVLKAITWANFKAVLKTYFDTIYGPLTVQPVIAVFFYPAVPTASALMLLFPAPVGITTLTAAVNMQGSSGKSLTAATAQTDFDVRKNASTSANGTSVGTVRFAAAGTVPTFIAASAFTFAGGADWLTVWAPATPDATLRDIAGSLYFTRS